MLVNTNDLHKRVKRLEKYRKKHYEDKPQKIVIYGRDGSVFYEIPIKWNNNFNINPD